MRTLVVVPCGAKKVWANHPHLGAVAARDAYTGTPFKVNRAYAEMVADAWVILSAKYGFLRPDDVVPGPYEVTFKRRATGPVAVAALREQVRDLQLAAYDRVIGLGGVEYRAALTGAFRSGTELVFPFAGLALGYSLQATNAATAAARAGGLQPAHGVEGRAPATSPARQPAPRTDVGVQRQKRFDSDPSGV